MPEYSDMCDSWALPVQRVRKGEAVSHLIYVGIGIVIGVVVFALVVRAVIRDVIGRGLGW